MITVGCCKGYDIFAVSKRKACKEDFFKDLSAVANIDEIKDKVLSALENDGKVYGLKKKKELVALMLFEKEVKNRYDFEQLVMQDTELGLTLDKLPKNLKKVTIFNYVTEYFAEGHDEAMKWFRESVRSEMQEYIMFGSCYIVNMEEETFTLADIEKEKFGFHAGGLAIGISLGLLFGIIFDNIGLGLCFGMAYSFLFGTALAGPKKGTKDAEDTENIKSTGENAVCSDEIK